MDGSLGKVPYTLADGREVELTANYGLLFKLRSQNKDVYKHYNEAFKLTKDEPDYACATILYAAYLMGVISEQGNIKDAMSEEEFLALMPFDREVNMRTMGQLVLPNRMTASAALS